MVPKSLKPCFVPLSISSRSMIHSEINVVSDGRLNITQCVHVPEGASGSSHIIAYLTVPETSSHSRGGETLTPLHAYLSGMGSPSLKTLLVTLIAIYYPPRNFF